jgi:transmembrane sensor
VSPSEPSWSQDDSDAVERRAADFLQRRRFWSWSDTDDAELEAWLAESLSHQVAYLRLEAGSSRIERLVALRPSSVDISSGRADVANSRHRWGLWRVALPVVAAGLLVMAFVFGVPLFAYLMQPADRTLATDVGGRAVVRFADGTEFDVNTDSVLRYRMTTQNRIVWLDRGEAYFRVAHDAANPFTVIAGGRRITDLGTEFMVRNISNAFEVALVKGKARLNSGAEVAMLTPGDDAVAMAGSLTITKKTQQELADELAWRRGVLVFRNATLADAVRWFNRYTQTKLVIADPGIAGLKIGGEFKIANVEDFLELAQAVLQVHVERNTNQILLSRAAGKDERAAKRQRSH